MARVVGLPADPRGQELIKLVARDQYERWLQGEQEAILLKHFQAVTHTLLDDPKALTPGQFRRQAALFRRTADILTDGYKATSQFSAAQLLLYTQVEADAAHAGLEAITGASLAQLTKPEIRAITGLPIVGLKLGDWWNKQAADMTVATRQQIQLGLLAGEGTEKIAGRILNAGTGPAVFNRARNNARLLARTSLTTVQNTAALESYKVAGKRISDRYTYVSARDARVTAICRGLDGQEFAYDDPKRKMPPQHIQCRSTIAPRVNFDKLGLKDPQAGKGPLGFTSYDDWLREQPAAVQDGILGKARAALWRDRKASLADMIDADNRLLTIDQLRDKITRVVPPPPAVVTPPVVEPPKPPRAIDPDVDEPPQPHEMKGDMLRNYVARRIATSNERIIALRAERDAIGADMNALFNKHDAMRAAENQAADKGTDAWYARQSARVKDNMQEIEAFELRHRAVSERYQKALEDTRTLFDDVIYKPRAQAGNLETHAATAADVKTSWQAQYAERQYGWKYQPEPPAAQAARLKGVDVFNRLTGVKFQPQLGETTPSVRFWYTRNRAYHQAGEIFVDDDFATVVHELGHALEYRRPDIAAKAIEWRNIRQQGYKLEKLRDRHPGVDYKDWEVTIVDKFKNDYIGKIYDGPDGKRASEVITMGLEALARDPERFYKEDPDFFFFILELFR